MGFRSFFYRKKKRNANGYSIDEHHAGSSHDSSRSSNHIEELEQVFNKFDANGDGKISVSELKSVLCSLGHETTEDKLCKMIKEVDADGDGCIDLEEFIVMNTKGVDSEEVLENLKGAFSVYDIDKNGSISAEELQQVMRSLGDSCSLEECRKMINSVDRDGDGTISFEEFKIMMMQNSRGSKRWGVNTD